MRTAFSKIGMAAASVALFAACSADAPPLGTLPGGGATVSQNEAAQIEQMLAGMAFEGFSFDQATPAYVPRSGGELSFNSVPITIDFSIDVTSDCPLGGTFGVSGNIGGSIDDQTFAGNLTLDVQESMSACTFQGDDTNWTITTNPDLHLQGSVAWDQTGQVGDATFTYDGGIIWNTADGRAGNCLVNLTLTVQSDGTELAAGQVCGFSV